jgi:hypothetical protein
MALPGMDAPSRSSIRGWILNAPTCAPSTPRRQARDDVGEIFKGTTAEWGSTTGGDFLGMQSPRRLPCRPTPRGNLLGDDLSAEEQFQCTSHRAHSHPGRSPRDVRKIHSNAPSEIDHPLFGIHDPFRKERLGPMLDTSLYTTNFMAPSKSSYCYQSAEPPYPDTAQHNFTFNVKDTMASHISEQQSKFQWPAWSVPLKPVRRQNELKIE